MAKLYASGVVVGLSPEQVKRCSVWEFSAVVNGYAEAHADRSGATLTESEKDALFDWIDQGVDIVEVASAPRYEATFGEGGFWVGGMRLLLLEGPADPVRIPHD